MKFRTGVALVLLAAATSACQPNAEQQLSGSVNSGTAVSEVPVDRQDCRSELSASVRGATGSFESAEEAARSVEELPLEGSLVQLELGADHATFGWMHDGELTHVTDTRRDDDAWTVGSYEKCTTEA